MSYTRIYVEPTETLTGQGKKKYPSQERPKLLVLLSGSCSPKLKVSIPIDQSVCYGLMGMENVILGERES